MGERKTFRFLILKPFKKCILSLNTPSFRNRKEKKESLAFVGSLGLGGLSKGLLLLLAEFGV